MKTLHNFSVYGFGHISSSKAGFVHYLERREQRCVFSVATYRNESFP